MTTSLKGRGDLSRSDGRIAMLSYQCDIVIYGKQTDPYCTIYTSVIEQQIGEKSCAKERECDCENNGHIQR